MLVRFVAHPQLLMTSDAGDACGSSTIVDDARSWVLVDHLQYIVLQMGKMVAEERDGGGGDVGGWLQ
jgi:hypothetical protein